MSATYTAWIDLQLSKESDLRNEIGDPGLLVKGGNPQAMIRAAQIAAKEDLRFVLMDALPDIFHSSLGLFDSLYGDAGLSWNAWFITAGYSYDTLDTILDVLVNPDQLRLAHVARTIWRLYLIRKSEMAATDLAQTSNQFDDQLAFWDAQYQERKTVGVRALKIDLNKDGVVTEWERTKSHTGTFMRV